MKRRHLHAFWDKYARERLGETQNLGIRTVEVARITGSVNRWADYDAQFRPLNRRDGRWKRILAATERGGALPAVHLYKVLDRYYVVDGNHRVAAARRVGQEYIDAHVIEYLPPFDTPEHILWRQRSFFEYRSWLRGIVLSEPGSYPLMLSYIQLFREERAKKDGPLTLRAAARRWYADVYAPLAAAVKKQRLIEPNSARTVGDLVLEIIHQKWRKEKAGSRPSSYRQAMKDLREGDYENLAGRIEGLSRGMQIKGACKACRKCLSSCPEHLIAEYKGRIRISDLCRECGRCREACPQGAIGPYRPADLENTENAEHNTGS
ncbi:MAG: 4Fe-4S dicluster domain-containing protein [Patescibacteria group bacterium]